MLQFDSKNCEKFSGRSQLMQIQTCGSHCQGFKKKTHGKLGINAIFKEETNGLDLHFVEPLKFLYNTGRKAKEFSTVKNTTD